MRKARVHRGRRYAFGGGGLITHLCRTAGVPEECYREHHSLLSLWMLQRLKSPTLIRVLPSLPRRGTNAMR
ncbi:hypothetical protein H5410_005693 [Solanum commersonii]|uniref:Uncharacterized protein n=1 Tax=Solanum commersonii TaxID=4109 RepID=A0A9J6A862_SOLCO|nr:hypothetical protein H5410_005693 [Solanum commersonii]